MFLLPSIALGIVFALVLGGKPSKVLEVRLRLPWMIVLALALQVLLFTPVGNVLPEFPIGPIHIASYAVLIVFGLANLRLRAFVPVLLGMTLNALAIVANGGSMPVSASAAAAAGIRADGPSNVSQGATHLRFLGDVFALPEGLPLANVFSIGDVLIGFGMAAFIVAVSLEGGRESLLDPRRMLEPLSSRSYRLLTVGRLVSHLGDWLTLAALVGWIYGETRSVGNVAVLMMCRLAPPILGGGVAAVVVDRLPKGRLLVWIEVARGLALAGALAGVVADEQVAVLAALGLSGALAAMANAAVPAFLPSFLPEKQLAAANAGIGIAQDAAMALGAVGAGVLLALVGVAWALAADLATFAAAAALFSLLPTSRALARDEPGRGSLSGLRYLLGTRGLLVLVLSFAAATLATGLANATLPRFLSDEVGLGTGAYGFGLAALAAGLALGQVFVGFSRVGPGAGRWIGAALILMAGFFIVLSLSDHTATALFLLSAIGFVDGTTDVVFDTVIQREADPSRLGSVFGLASAAMTATMMGSFAAAPLLNRLFDPHWLILGAGVVLVGAGLIALLGMRAGRLAAPASAAVSS